MNCASKSAAVAVLATMTAIAAQPAAAAEGARIHLGEAVKLGQGMARTMVVENAAGKPATVAVLMSEAALEGLPKASGHGHQAFETVLPMPAGGPKTGYDHATLDWNPTGHIPDGVYSVPHFDVHFYLIDGASRDAITFQGDAAAEAGKAPDVDLMPAGYVAPPDTAVEKMGLHGVNPAGPEFNGKPFTATFIYGYHRGETIFVEPMVATSFLEGKPDVTMPVATPKAYSRPGYYPTRYRVAWDPAARSYVVALGGLKPWRLD